MEMPMKAKHAFGMLENIDEALSNGVIDNYDILFVKDASGKPYVGWIDKNGDKVIVNDSAELAALEAEIATKVGATEIEEAIATKADASVVEALEALIAEKVSAAEVDAKIATVVEEKIAEVESSYEFIEF